MFTPASLFGQFLFGAIGACAFAYGKSQAAWKPLFWGLGLMVFPYLVSDTAMLYLIGTLLTAGLWVGRE